MFRFLVSPEKAKNLDSGSSGPTVPEIYAPNPFAPSDSINPIIQPVRKISNHRLRIRGLGVGRSNGFTSLASQSYTNRYVRVTILLARGDFAKIDRKSTR